MRGGTNWRSIIQAPEGHWAFSFLEVTDFDGTWVNLGNLAIGERNADFLNGYDLEDDIDRNTPTFSATLRGSVGAFSLMPFRTDSPLNVDGDGAYQPLLDLHREWRLWVCFTPRGTFPEGPEDYRERARGVVDRIDLSFSRDEIRVQGRGPEADFIDDLVVCDEVTPKVYAAGPVADVLQAMLDDRYGVATYTLVVDGSAPSTFIDEITYTEPFSFWKVFSDVAAVGTGIVRFLYDDSDVLAIHLFTPDRDAITPQWSVDADEYGDIDNGLDLSTVANYIVARFVNASGAIETVTSPTVDPAITPTASTARYGIKAAVITLAPNIGLSDATRVQAMIDAIRADRELPILGQVIKGSGLWFGELWDFVATPANAVLYDEDQAGGVVGYHESCRNSVIDNVFTLAGKPKGRYATWLEISGAIPTAADIAPGVTSSSATFKEISFLLVTVAAVEFVCTVNDRTQSAQVDLYSDSALTTLVDSSAYDVTSAAPLTGAFFSTVTPLARDVVYYVKITPYSGPLVSAVPTGTAGPYALPNTNVLPEPTDTPSLTWDRSDPSKLQANVVGSTTGTPDDIIAATMVTRVAFFQSVNGVLELASIPAATTEVTETVSGATIYRQGANLTGAGSARLIANITDDASSGTMAIEYRPLGGSWTAFTPTIGLTELDIVRSAYADVPTDMADDVDLRPVTAGGGGTAAVKIASLTLELVPGTVTPPTTPTTDLPPAGLIAWWKADAGITKDGSDKVSQWDDQSGNGHHLTQPTGTNQPTWQAAIKNGLPGIFFPSPTGLLYPSGVTGVMAALFVVTYPNTTWDGFSYLTTTSSPGRNIWGFPGLTSFQETPFNGGTAVFRHNGVVQSDGASLAPLNRSHYFVGYADTLSPVAMTQTLGSYPDYDQNWKGHIHEVAYWDAQLTSGQIADIESYVIAKYGSTW